MAALIGSLRVSLCLDTAAVTDGIKQAQSRRSGEIIVELPDAAMARVEGKR